MNPLTDIIKGHSIKTNVVFKTVLIKIGPISINPDD